MLKKLSTHLLPTTVVGSYPQPEWLIDREALKGSTVPRVRRKEIWRIADAAQLEEAQDDATVLHQVHDQRPAALAVRQALRAAAVRRHHPVAGGDAELAARCHDGDRRQLRLHHRADRRG